MTRTDVWYMMDMKEGSDNMNYVLKNFGGVVFFYSIIILGVLLLLIKNSNYNNIVLDDENNITIAYLNN